MAVINTAAQEITAKIVYYGPGLSGKTTNLEQIRDRVDPSTRGRFLSLQTEGDRTLFFDMMPVEAGQISGFDLRFQFYTVPGQVYYNASRREVLKNVDGVVFVATSRPSRREANIESMQNLYDNMDSLDLPAPGTDEGDVPLVLQYNKRDLSGALPVEILQQDLNYEAAPAWEAIAIQGIGVLETLGEAMQMVEKKLRKKYRR